MNDALHDYIKAAKARGHSPSRVHDDLLAAGWDTAQVNAAIAVIGSDVDMTHVASFKPQLSTKIHRISVRGLQYYGLFISLAVAALSLGSMLHSIVNSLTSEEVISGVFIISLGLSVALFIILFRILRKAELADPSLRNYPLRHRLILSTLVAALLISLGNFAGFIIGLLNSSSTLLVNSDGSVSIVASFIDLIVTLTISATIFIYYWRQDHRLIK